MKELSVKNPYYLPKNRYYELLYFCRQYKDYENKIDRIRRSSVSRSIMKFDPNYIPGDSKVERDAIELELLTSKLDLIDNTMRIADPELYSYMHLAITEGKTYEWLEMNKNIPCCRNTFYDRYRRFFWLLDKAKTD